MIIELGKASVETKQPLDKEPDFADPGPFEG